MVQQLKGNLKSSPGSAPLNFDIPDAESEYEDQRAFEDFEASLSDAEKSVREKRLFAFMDRAPVVTPRKLNHS